MGPHSTYVKIEYRFKKKLENASFNWSFYFYFYQKIPCQRLVFFSLFFIKNFPFGKCCIFNIHWLIGFSDKLFGMEFWGHIEINLIFSRLKGVYFEMVIFRFFDSFAVVKFELFFFGKMWSKQTNSLSIEIITCYTFISIYSKKFFQFVHFNDSYMDITPPPRNLDSREIIY